MNYLQIRWCATNELEYYRTLRFDGIVYFIFLAMEIDDERDYYSRFVLMISF